jgi:hypothetical protein
MDLILSPIRFFRIRKRLKLHRPAKLTWLSEHSLGEQMDEGYDKLLKYSVIGFVRKLGVKDTLAAELDGMIVRRGNGATGPGRT